MSDPRPSPPPSATSPPKGLRARIRRLDPVLSVATFVLAAATYIPSFLTKPGMIADDSKQYLYLDPGKLISSAISMWDPDVGLGTVTHQNIGFLFPMGPYYWIIQELHIPMWVGQRFWMGSLFFFAGSGVFFLGRLLGLSRWGCVAAGATYTFTPFVIDYIARISPIVMPWSALGWMLGFVILSVRRGGWRYPALFAIVIALVGGVNATSILLAGLAPALWIIHAVFVSREVPARRALGAVIRLGVLSAGVSLWWVAGLWAEGVYGLNVLKFTETIPTVASTSLSSEVIRGLGYWYFYGQDKLQPWTSAAPELHAVDLADRGELRRADAVRRRGVLRPLALPGLRGRAPARGRRRRGRRLPLRPPLPARHRAAGGRLGLDDRPGDALDEPHRPARGPRTRPPARLGPRARSSRCASRRA